LQCARLNKGKAKLGTIVSIVDDDPWAREGIKELVASYGYHALSFGSAEEFIESGSATDSECVILDVQMPGVTGLELQDWLAARGYATAVILMTAYPDDESRRRALDSGALAFLTKPLDDVALLQCLASALGSSSS